MTKPMTEPITPELALQKLAAASDQRYVTMFKLDLLELEYYKPAGHDPQKPHTRDEVYFVISGTGWFVKGSQRHRFAPNEVLYVPAGVAHHFEDFTDDFSTWAIFSG